MDASLCAILYSLLRKGIVDLKIHPSYTGPVVRMTYEQVDSILSVSLDLVVANSTQSDKNHLSKAGCLCLFPCLFCLWISHSPFLFFLPVPVCLSVCLSVSHLHPPCVCVALSISFCLPHSRSVMQVLIVVCFANL